MDRWWSWAATPEVVQERQAQADALIGLRLEAVRYINLDYRRHELFPDARGPRWISDATEWADPTWRYDTCDSIDFGVEIVASTQIFSVTWDPPGDHEGIGIQPAPLLGTGVEETAGVAVWDVGRRSRWTPYIGDAVTSVELHYLPWDGTGSSWCTRITVRFATEHVVLLLGEAGADGEIEPSADNVAVLFSPDQLPSWDRRS